MVLNKKGDVNIKNIVIFGVARTGKTTFARMIKKKYDNYNIIDGDCIRATFEKVFPQTDINHLGGEGMKEDFPKFCANLFEYQIKQHKNIFNYIFESCDITPFYAKKYFDSKDTIILFLGYPKLTVTEVYNNYKNYAISDDYMLKKTDDEIMDRAYKWLERSKQLKEECIKYNIKFIDVSYDRNEIFNKLIKEIKDE